MHFRTKRSLKTLTIISRKQPSQLKILRFHSQLSRIRQTQHSPHYGRHTGLVVIWSICTTADSQNKSLALCGNMIGNNGGFAIS